MTRAGAVLGTTTTGTRAYRAREEPFGRARTGEIPYHALGGSTLLSSRNLASWRLISSWVMAHGRIECATEGEARPLDHRAKTMPESTPIRTRTG